MAHIKDVKIGSNTYLIEPTVYAATAGTASAITAAITNFALDTGAVVTLKITTTNDASATLNVNSTGAKDIIYKNANITANALSANRVYSFVYDGTYWQLIGELDTTYDDVTTSTHGLMSTADKTKLDTLKDAPFIMGSQMQHTSQWTGVASTLTNLVNGQTIYYYLPYNTKSTDYSDYTFNGITTSGVALNLTLADSNKTGPLPVFYQGMVRVGSQYTSGTLLVLTYIENAQANGSTIGTGWWVHAQYNTDTTTQLKWDSAVIVAGTAGIFPRTLIMMNSNGKYESIVTSASTSNSKTKNTVGFLPHTLLYYSGTQAVTEDNRVSSTGSIFQAFPSLDFSYSANIISAPLTSNRPVFLIGKIGDNGAFYLENTWWTQDLPSSDDGNAYMYVGVACGTTSTYSVTLNANHPIFMYKNNGIREISTYAIDASKVNGHTVGKDVPVDAVFKYTFSDSSNSNQFTVTPLGGTAQTITITPSIANNITGTGASGYLATFNDTNTITNGPQLGSDTTKFLDNTGAWAVPDYPVLTVAGKTGKVTLTKNDVGLNNVDNTADANKTVNALTDFKVSTHTLPHGAGVRIKYPIHSPVLISCQQSTSGGRLILLGGGYGGNTLNESNNALVRRNNFVEIVSPSQQDFTWNIPISEDNNPKNPNSALCSLDIMHNTTGDADAYIKVWASDTCDFATITDLTGEPMNAPLLTNKSDLAWAKITNTPTTISGYGIQNAVTTIASTDEAIVRFNGTSGQVQNSGITISDDNRLTINHAQNKQDGVLIKYGTGATTTASFFMGVGQQNQNYGIYDYMTSNWILSSSNSQIWKFYGNLKGQRGASTAQTDAPGPGEIQYLYNVDKDYTGFSAANDANSIITLNNYTSNYCSQLGVSSNGNLYYRSFSNQSLDTTTAWKQIAFTDSTVANATNLVNAPSLAVDTNDSNKITVTAGGKTSDAFTVPFATSATSATSADKLATIQITSENDIPFEVNPGGSTATYKGSGNTWTGDITSMKYAGILHVANDNRSWEIWAQRESSPTAAYPHSPLHWRNRLVGGQDQPTGWAPESIIPDIDATDNTKGDLGSASQPIYAKGGRLLPCTYTLNVASSDITTSKIYLIGAENQSAYATTNSDLHVYATNGALSVGSLKLNANTDEEKVNIEYNTTSECITFSFE